MYCINYGSFDYGQGHSRWLHRSMRMSSLVRTRFLLPPWNPHCSDLPFQVVGTSFPPAELFITRQYVAFLLSTLCRMVP
jgi:hypothetical protein